MLRYPAIMHNDDDGFWIEFPDFPGSYTWGGAEEIPEEAAANCLADSLLFLMQEGKPLPEPTAVSEASFLVAPRYTAKGLENGKRVYKEYIASQTDREISLMNDSDDVGDDIRSAA
ncbi:MAG: type II toxin-antitoxin system HicB family antitoxin [Rhodospirillaceae bacterium]